MRRCALSICLLTAALHAQYPPGTQWRKIQTAHYELVFPREIEADAQRAANMLETLYGPIAESLGGAQARRTTILLPNQGVTRYIGGYVSLFPRMAVFNSMPSQGFWGTNDWLTTLAAQEGRHLVQIAKMNHGFGKVASVMFGEAGTATILGLTLPNWWTQGDARVAASSVMRGGIGQFASSEAATRAWLTSGKHFSYMKAIHGSYKDFTPGSEELGSFMIGHVNRKAGAEAWNNIMSRTANRSWNPFGLSMAMKKETGLGAAGTYQETISELDELFHAKADQREYSNPAILNTAPKPVFTAYAQPVYEAGGSVVAQKSGMDTFPIEVVRLHPDGREERLFRFVPTVITSNRTSIVNGRMVWDEYVPDVRWRRGYSEIVIRDMAAGHTRRLTHHTRFMNPVLSPDGARVAVVEYLPDRRCSLVILDAAQGNELRRLPSPGNDMIYTPAWSEDAQRVAMILQSEKGRALDVADLTSGAFQEVLPHGDDDLANPVMFGNYVLYKSSSDGINNIQAVEIATGRRYRVTSSKFGADFPSISPDRTKLLYSDYTNLGNNVAELPLDPASWTRIAAVPYAGLHYLGQYKDYSSQAPSTKYDVDRYRPSLHLVTAHSWGLTSGPPEIGFGVMSNDKMGLMGLTASALYNTSEGTTGFQTGGYYSGFFPVLYSSFSDKNRRVEYVDHTANWTERTLTGGFYVPLNFSRGYYASGLSFGAAAQDIHLYGGSLAPLGYGMALWHWRFNALRDLATTWAQVLRFDYRHTPDAGRYTGNYLMADGLFYVPGLARHHALKLEGGYERQAGNYFFSSQLAFPRGYTSFTGRNLTKLSATYGVPLWYPDRAISQLLYVKRVSGNLFYDYGRVTTRGYRSTGVELVFDLNLLHFPDNFKAGVRYAYRLDYHNARVNPFLAFSF
jgi:hypothetical protein